MRRIPARPRPRVAPEASRSAILFAQIAQIHNAGPYGTLADPLFRAA